MGVFHVFKIAQMVQIAQNITYNYICWKMLITLSMSKPIKSKGQERGVEKLGEKVKKKHDWTP